MTIEVFLGHLFRRAPFRGERPRGGADGINDLRAPAVVERDAQSHACVSRCPLDRLLKLAADAFAQRVGAAYRLEANVLAVNLVEFEAEIALEHPHQRVNFESRTLPVLGREGVQSQRFESE